MSIFNPLGLGFLAKHSHHPFQCFNESVDFLLRVVKSKRSPDGAGNAQQVNQGLCTVMSCPHCNAQLVEQHSNVVGMDIPDHE